MVEYTILKQHDMCISENIFPWEKHHHLQQGLWSIYLLPPTPIPKKKFVIVRVFVDLYNAT